MAKKMQVKKKNPMVVGSSNGAQKQEKALSKLSQKKILPLIKNTSTSYSLNIPVCVEKKIRRCCEVVNDIEWSGVLFYTHSGTFTDNNEEESLVIDCVDFIPMDIGNAGSTEFELTEDVIAYMVDNDLLDCKSGLIHSHHNMATYFSGTDLNTLASEGTYMNNFVSLIVNNSGKYTAGITRKIKEEREVVAYRSSSFFDSDLINIPDVTGTEVVEYVEWFSLDINKDEYEKDQDIITLEERLAELKKPKVKPTFTSNKTTMTKKTKPAVFQNQFNFQEDTYYSQFDDYLDDYLDGYKYYDTYTDYKNSKKQVQVGFDEQVWYRDDLYGDIDYGMLLVNELIIDDLIAQIVTGDVTYLPGMDFNAKEFIENEMEAIYDSRFLSSENLSFREFAEAFVDILLSNIQDPDLQAEGLDTTEVGATYAYHAILDLSQYSTNSYLETYKDILNQYVEL